jgi:hypothetical protein
VPPTEPEPKSVPCGPAQSLDAVEVEQVDVGREERQGDDALVEIDADLLLHSRLVADDLAGGDAAHRHLALARPEILDREAGDVAGQVLDRRRARPLDVGFALRVDREGNVLHRRCAPGGGDDDLVVPLRFLRARALRAAAAWLHAGDAAAAIAAKATPASKRDCETVQAMVSPFRNMIADL